jgi:AcrR family transcriptional regulator
MPPATPNPVSLSSAPRERARTARREALLETAETVFAERGFAGATMAEIAARAGYSAGNLYNVFESKEALYRELVTTRGTKLLLEQLAILRQEAPYLDTLDRVIDHLLQFCVDHRAFWVLYVRGLTGQEWSGAPFPQETQLLRQELEQESLQRLVRAMEQGELPHEDPNACATMILGTLHHHIVHWIEGMGSAEELWESAKRLRRVLRRGLGVPA